MTAETSRDGEGFRAVLKVLADQVVPDKRPENAIVAELWHWTTAARRRLVDHDTRIPPALYHLEKLLASPSRGYPALLRNEMLNIAGSTVFPEDHAIYHNDGAPPGIGEQRIFANRGAIVQALDILSRARGSALPASYVKFFHDDMSRKFMRGTLGAKGDEDVADLVTAVFMRNWPSVVGHAGFPASKGIHSAVIWTSSEGKDALVVSAAGIPYSFFVPSSLARTNGQAIAACENEIARVQSGAPRRLSPGRNDATIQALFDLPSAPPGAAAAQQFLPEEPLVTAALEEARSGVLSLRRAGRTAFSRDGTLEWPYRRIQHLFQLKLREAREAVAGAIDPEARGLLQSFGVADVSAMSWFCGADDMLPSPDAKRRRQDAEDAFLATGPLFHLASRPEFRKAVSNRQPIVPVIREITGLTKAQIAAIASMGSPARPEDVIRTFIPAEPEVMRRMTLGDMRLASDIFDVLRAAQPAARPAALAAEAVKPFLGMVQYRFRGFKDAITAIEERIARPMMMKLHGEENPVTASFLRTALFPRTAAQLADVNRDYHESRLWEQNQMHGGAMTIATWAPLTSPREYGGIAVLELSSSDAIRAQGREQRHCVGTYADSVLYGHCLILRLAREGKGTSTAEIVMRSSPAGPGGTVLDCVQHLGPGNRDPEREDVEALEQFLQEENESLTASRTLSYVTGLQEAGRSAIRLPGSDPRFAFLSMSPILPARVARAGYDSLFEAAAANFERRAPDTEEPRAVEAAVEVDDGPTW